MKFDPAVELNSKTLRRREWLRVPLVRAAVRRHKRRISASGILIGVVGSTAFAGALHVYTTGSGASETVPGGSTATIEAWGSGGGGGAGAGSGCGATQGGGGGASGYCRSTQNIAAQAGNTYTFTVGQPVSNGATGNATTISAGTVTGFAMMTANGGGGGGAAPAGAAGTGASASGGTATNVTGANGQSGSLGGLGATGTSGTVSGDGSPHGGGGQGHLGAGSGGSSQVGAAVFSYV